MKTRLLNRWEKIRTSLWFIPALLAIFASASAFALIELDKSLPVSLREFLYAGGAEGARLLLTTIAGSMITIAGVTFSITIVALTLTTSQFGPRLLRNFMADKVNQIVLGAFIATFIYCLLVLRGIRVGDNTTFIPELAVSFSFVLALVNLGILIYFFHHVSTSIHADQVIQSVYNTLKRTISENFQGADDPAPQGGPPVRVPDFENNSATVNSASSGYLRFIAVKSLLDLAVQNDLVMRLKVGAGDFVFADTPVAEVIPKAALDDHELQNQIKHAFLLGSQRTPEQDIEFAIHQMVEIAVRALSPGINDPYTAMSCIYRLGDIICEINSMQFPDTYKYDDEGRLRLILDVSTYEGILDAAFNQIRQFAANSVAVYVCMLETLSVIALSIHGENQFEAVQKHSEMIYRSAKSSVQEKEDLEDIEERFERIMKVIPNGNE